MDQKTKNSLVRANVLAATVFLLFLVAFFALAYTKAPGGMPPREAYTATESGQDIQSLRAYLRSCLIAEARHAKTLSRTPLEFAFLGAAASLLAAIVFGANALSIRNALTDGGSNQ